MGKTPGSRNWKYSGKLDTGHLLFALSDLLATFLFLHHAQGGSLHGRQWTSLLSTDWDTGKLQQDTGGTEEGERTQSMYLPGALPVRWPQAGRVCQPTVTVPFRVASSLWCSLTTFSLSFWAMDSKSFSASNPQLPCYPFHFSLPHPCLMNNRFVNKSSSVFVWQLFPVGTRTDILRSHNMIH